MTLLSLQLDVLICLLRLTKFATEKVKKYFENIGFNPFVWCKIGVEIWPMYYLLWSYLMIHISIEVYTNI